MRPRAGNDGLATAAGTTAVAGMAATAVLASFMVAAAPAAAAKPKPPAKSLAGQERSLSDKAEQLTEQYNRLQVRLKQAERAAKAAKATAARQQLAMQQARGELAQVAADSFKTGGDDPVATFMGSGDYQSTLDRAATVNYFANQSSTKVTQILQTMQSADRALKSAQNTADQVRRLAAANKRAQQQIKSVLAKVDRKLGKKPAAAPVRSGPIPSVAPGGASAKAQRAVKAALAVLGTPYSYGGGTASGPSFGVAQGSHIRGFDCSGLTLYAYAKVGINLPHYTGDQFNAGTHVAMNQMRPGDLVFFYSDKHHMGMYIGHGKMIHAPQTGERVKISSISGRPFAGAVRVA